METTAISLVVCIPKEYTISVPSETGKIRDTPSMTPANPVKPLKGLWCRFSKYEFHREERPGDLPGGYICPAPSATLEWYDPWEQYDLSNTQEGFPRPYEALFALTDLKVPHRIEMVLEWCARHGLLGVLPQTAYRIQKPPRWVGDEKRWFKSYEWEWIGGEWRLATHFSPLDARSNYSELEAIVDQREGDYVETSHPAYTAPNVFFRSTAFRRVKFDFSPDHPIPASELPAVFFSRIAEPRSEVFDCPRPGTQQFWRIYSEPFWLFDAHARLFGAACRHLFDGGRSATKPAQEKTLRERLATPRYLERYLAPLSIGLHYRTDGTVAETWNSPSLVCTFARMALQDAMGGYTLQSCECCGTLFIRRNPRSLYCSEKCGYRLRKRRARSLVDKVP